MAAGKSDQAGEIYVRDAALVLCPVVSVFLRAAMLVAQRAVHDHDGKEGRVQVPEQRSKPTTKASKCITAQRTVMGNRIHTLNPNKSP